MSDNNLLALASDLRRLSVESDGGVMVGKETKLDKHRKNLSRHRRKVGAIFTPRIRSN